MFAKLKSRGWRLDDGEARHRANPATFEIPPLAERKELKEGSYVKLIFMITVEGSDGKTFEQAERMWVRVEGRMLGRFVGVLDNDPCSSTDLRRGARVSFLPRHVIDTATPPATYVP